MVRVLRLILISLLVFSVNSYSADVQPLPIDKAFDFHAYYQNNQLLLQWNIAPGYFLYHDKLSISSSTDLVTIFRPPFKLKKMSTGKTERVYVNKLTIAIPIISKESTPININYQGCSDAGYCYPPVSKKLNFNFKNINKNIKLTNINNTETLSDQDYATSILKNDNFIFTLILFLGLGLLLSFTPCVLPMIPILSGIIAGHSRTHLTTSKAFMLSFSYVIGMALTYMGLGIIVALIGNSIAVLMQTPGTVLFISAFFVVLALSLFGLFEFGLPARFQKILMKWDRHFKGGTYSGAFLMGVFSSLIVSPCVSAPLAGVLTYIAHRGNIILGAIALFALGLGMGLPLLLIGTSAGKWLPRSGPWMVHVQKFFGILMLGVAIWLLSRIFHPKIIILLWASLAILVAILLGTFRTAKQTRELFSKIIGILFLIYGVLLMMNLPLTQPEPLNPWRVFKHTASSQKMFITLQSMKELDDLLIKAKEEKKPVILVFYADWCVTCKIIETSLFENPLVQTQLKNVVLLKADITKNNKFDKKLLKRFQVIAPPTLLFFNTEGQELRYSRLIGEIKIKELLMTINKANEWRSPS